jgi:hypothetical protein
MRVELYGCEYGETAQTGRELSKTKTFRGRRHVLQRNFSAEVGPDAGSSFGVAREHQVQVQDGGGERCRPLQQGHPRGLHSSGAERQQAAAQDRSGVGDSDQLVRRESARRQHLARRGHIEEQEGHSVFGGQGRGAGQDQRGV